MLPFLLCLVLPPRHACGQSPEGSDPRSAGGWSVSLGIARRGVSDGLASPLRQHGTGPLIGGAYRSGSDRGAWRLHVSYAPATVGSSLQTPRGGYEKTQQVDIGFVSDRRVAALAADRVGLYLGAAIDVRASLRKHYYDLHSQGTGTESFADLFAPIQIAGMWDYSIGSAGHISHRVSVPVFSFVLRSPYTGLKYMPDLVLAGPTSATGFDSDLTVRIVLNTRWTLGAFHRMTVLHYPDPLPLASVVHRLGIEVEL